jgi:hypothetical protein
VSAAALASLQVVRPLVSTSSNSAKSKLTVAHPESLGSASGWRADRIRPCHHPQAGALAGLRALLPMSRCATSFDSPLLSCRQQSALPAPRMNGFRPTLAAPCRQRSRGNRVAQRTRCPEGAEARARAQTGLDHVAAQATAISTASHARGLLARRPHVMSCAITTCAIGRSRVRARTLTSVRQESAAEAAPPPRSA